MSARRVSFAALACPALVCAALAAPAAAQSVVTVEASYLERIATPPGAVLVATLEDVSRADAPSVELGRATVEDAGNPPWRVAIAYVAGAIEPAGVYAVRATLRVDGQLWFTTADHHPVLTGGAGDAATVVMVRVLAPEASPPLKGTRWSLTALGASAATVAAPGHATFDAEGRVGGQGGCNTFGGAYLARPDGAFLAGPTFSTMMACEPARMEQERAVFGAFEAARFWRIDGAALTLSGADGAALATFSDAAQETPQ